MTKDSPNVLLDAIAYVGSGRQKLKNKFLNRLPLQPIAHHLSYRPSLV